MAIRSVRRTRFSGTNGGSDCVQQTNSTAHGPDGSDVIFPAIAQSGRRRGGCHRSRTSHRRAAYCFHCAKSNAIIRSMNPGTEWLIDASGCDAGRLCELRALRAVCEEIVSALGLQVVGSPLWHQFPPPGGVTGMYLLSESHLTCHTFPESGAASFNLYCCRPRSEWDWAAHLASSLGAAQVLVRRIDRNRHAESDLVGTGVERREDA